MGAAEKLEALNERRSVEDLMSYHEALPEIIAVVKAAANHVDEEWAAFVEYGEEEDGDMPPNTSVTNAKLVAALSALDERLG